MYSSSLPRTTMLRFFLLLFAALACFTGSRSLAQSDSEAASKRPPKTQYGLFRLSYWATEDPLVNSLLNNSAPKLEWTWGYRKANSGWPFEKLVEQGLYDLKRHMFCGPLPEGAFIDLGFARGAAKAAPVYFSGKWVVTWDGTGTVEIALGASKSIVKKSENRLEFWAKTEDPWTRVHITNIGPECVHNVRAFRASDETLVQQGRVFRQHFIDFVSAHDVVRTIDWSASNNSHIRSIDQVTPWGSAFWGEKGFAPLRSDGPFTYTASKKPVRHAIYASAPLKLHFRLAKRTGAALWYNIPPMLGRPAFPGDVDWSNPKSFDYVAQARQPSVAGPTLTSIEWARFADALVAELIAEDYPEDRLLYLEIGNEVWNRAFPFYKHSNHFGGLGLYLQDTRADYPGGSPMRVAYGYVTAMFAEQFAAALERANRKQAWKMVVATQTVWPDGRLKPALDGLVWYNETDAKRPQPRDRFGYATTSYYSGGFYYTKDNLLFGEKYASKQAWRERWLAELEADPEALAARIEDYLINGPEAQHTIRHVIARHRENERMAKRYDIDFIGDYEGSSHDNIRDKVLSKDPTVVDFYRAWMRSDRAARVQAAMNEALLKEAPSAILANYVRFGRQKGAFGPWLELNDPLDSTPASRYWDRFIGLTSTHGAEGK